MHLAAGKTLAAVALFLATARRFTALAGMLGFVAIGVG
jgi:hypothetical protein